MQNLMKDKLTPHAYRDKPSDRFLRLRGPRRVSESDSRTYNSEHRRLEIEPLGEIMLVLNRYFAIICLDKMATYMVPKEPMRKR